MLAPVVLVAGVFGARAILKARSQFGTVEALPFYSQSAYGYGGGKFYYAAGDKLVIYDPSSPDNAQSIALGSKDVSIAAGGGTVALYAGSSVQILGTSEPIDAGGQIMLLRCAAAHIALLRVDSTGAGAVLVYAKDGTLVDMIEENNDKLLDCGFYTSEGRDALWTMSLSSSAVTPITTLTTYTYSSENGTGVATMSGVITLQAQLVDKAVFTPKSIFLSGTEQLIRYDSGISGESWRLLTYGYKLADYSTASSRPLFLFVPRDGTIDVAKLYSAAEDSTHNAYARTVQLDEDIHSTMVCGGRMYAFGSDSMHIYTAAGKQGDIYKLEFNCTGAVKLDDSHIVCEDANGALYYLTLK